MKFAQTSLLSLGLLLLAPAATAQGQLTDAWASGETLLWWVKNGPAPPPLATTAPADSVATPPGALGNPDTTVLLGGQDVTHPMQVGGRFTLGAWLADASPIGVEGSYLFLGKSDTSATATSDGSRYLLNPFEDVSTGSPVPNANFLVLPGVVNDGSATLTATHKLQGFEINGLYALQRNRAGYVTLIGGYRHLNVDEGLTLQTEQSNDVSFYPGEFAMTTDQFNASNSFNGGQLGVRGQWNRGGWSFGGSLKAALGNTREVLDVRGSTTTNAGPSFAFEVPVETAPTGIYAEPTNIGNFHRDRFAVLPEVTLRLGRQVTRRLQLFVGYDFLYLSSVTRPGDAIDGTINSTQLVSFTGLPPQPLVGEARPAPRFESSSYWAQGINLGAQLAW